MFLRSLKVVSFDVWSLDQQTQLHLGICDQNNVLGPHSGHNKSNILRAGPIHLCFKEPCRWFWSHWRLRSAVRCGAQFPIHVWLVATPQTVAPGPSVHGDPPGKNTGMAYHALLQGIFPTQGLRSDLPHCRQMLHRVGHQGSPGILAWAVYPFSMGFSQPRNWAGVSCIAGGFFSSWAIREALEKHYLRAKGKTGGVKRR